MEVGEKGGEVWRVYVDRNFLLDGWTLDVPLSRISLSWCSAFLYFVPPRSLQFASQSYITPAFSQRFLTLLSM